MKRKTIYAVIEVFILAVTGLLAFTALNKEYLFQWAAHNWKFSLVLAAVALVLILFNKQFVSAFMTAGIVLGIFAGSFIGNIIKDLNVAKITEGMKPEEIYRLRHHPGFEIWMGIILLSILAGIIIQVITSKRA
ncbi:MAG TPA: hypothetical protein GXX75_05000 [Clostridiales bacterium]|nr:hypothetical protein [Clostridiales bacterium]